MSERNYLQICAKKISFLLWEITFGFIQEQENPQMTIILSLTLLFL